MGVKRIPVEERTEAEIKAYVARKRTRDFVADCRYEPSPDGRFWIITTTYKI